MSAHPAKHDYRIVNRAYYYGIDGVTHPIAGVPAYKSDGFGLYRARYPHEAAQKAYGGLVKYMQRFSTEGPRPDQSWFPGYNRKHAPMMWFRIQDMETGKTYDYRGTRERAKQSQDGPRVIINREDGRERVYNWVNRVSQIQASPEEPL
jgi:hypothetical protein